MNKLPADIETSVQFALAEDVGKGDLTAALIAHTATATASIVLREAAVICGIPWVDEVFRQLDGDTHIEWFAQDGDYLDANSALCRISGNARALLTGERTALNFLQTLSGTATVTAQYVKAVEGTNTKILDTRKTVPGLRLAQKYAVRCGGGKNHRVGLYDAILIKENHIATAESLSAVVARATQLSPGTMIEVEIETLDQLQAALDTGATRLLLDNFTIETLHKAVALRDSHPSHRKTLEASGGIDLKNIREVAETGVDLISIGALTKHIRAIDYSMRSED